jgi:hypothetical protein
VSAKVRGGGLSQGCDGFTFQIPFSISAGVMLVAAGVGCSPASCLFFM